MFHLSFNNLLEISSPDHSFPIRKMCGIILLLFLSLGLLVSLSFFLSLILEFRVNYGRSGLKKSSANYVTPYAPPSYPIIGCLISFYRNRRRLLDWYTDLLNESPRKTILVRRLGARRTIVTADSANVEHILRANFGNYPKGEPFTDILGDFLGRGIFNADGELWSAQRKLASHEFSTKSLREFVVRTLEAEVESWLLPLLEEHCLGPKNNGTVGILDLQEILSRFAFDTVCQVSLGMDPCCLDISRPVPVIVTAFDNASMISAMRGMAPIFLVWKLKRAMNIGSEKELAEAVREVHRAVSEIIQNKKNELIEREKEANHNKSCDGDLLTRLLAAGHNQEVIRDMVISFIMAGRDTTSAAMTWLFWLLSEHPETENDIVREVDSILMNRTTPGNALDFEALKEMKVLKASLCESMRLYPPVAWDSKHAAGEDVLPDGTLVRKGDRVTYFPYGMGRMAEIWGKDRLEFRPSRWFAGPGNTGELRAVSPFEFPVFQAGPRVCLGKEMAFIQMKYVVASILRRFEIRPVRKDQPKFVPLLTAHMAGGLKVTVRRRSTGPCV